MRGNMVMWMLMKGKMVICMLVMLMLVRAKWWCAWGGGVQDEMNDDASYNDSDDEIFNYNSALEIVFDDNSDENDNFMKDIIANLNSM